jgi:hypothetical protein
VEIVDASPGVIVPEADGNYCGFGAGTWKAVCRVRGRGAFLRGPHHGMATTGPERRAHAALDVNGFFQ